MTGLGDIILVTYSVILPLLIGYMIYQLKQYQKHKDAYNIGLMLLLRVQLIEYHDKYMLQNSIPSYAYSNFIEMYEAYTLLGGNGMVTKMKKEIDELYLTKKIS